jgi:hypothetical protein
MNQNMQKPNKKVYMHVDIHIYTDKDGSQYPVRMEVKCKLLKGIDMAKEKYDQNRVFKNLLAARIWAREYSQALQMMVPNAVIGTIERINN